MEKTYVFQTVGGTFIATVYNAELPSMWRHINGRRLPAPLKRNVDVTVAGKSV